MPVLPRKVEKVRYHSACAGQAAVAVLDDRVVHDGVGPEQRAAEVVLGDHHLVREVLELGQLADHGHELGDVRLDRRADHPVRARFAAETTALSDASRMDESRPTPHHVDPSGPAHSTYATAEAPEPSVERVLGVVLHLQHDTEVGLQGGDQRVDRPVALPAARSGAGRRRAAAPSRSCGPGRSTPRS